MLSGWQYRVVSTGGVIAATTLALLVANHAITQAFVTGYLPLVRRLDPVVLSGTGLLVALALSVAVVFVCLIPLYKPRPRRALDTIFLAEKRVLTALFALATIGYFNWSYRLPRATLFVTGAILFLVLPAWFLAIRNRPSTRAGRALVVGDDPDRIEQAMKAVDMPVIGYLAPPITVEAGATEPTVMADGGVLQTRIGNVECLGGISRLEQVLIRYNVDTVVLAFENTDRGEFFGVLEVCHQHGVEAKVLREHADSVLLSEETAGDLMTVDLEPWDWQDRLFKRGFDIAFSSVGLLVFGPVLGLIALAIRLDSPGPVFYTQSRTAGLGGTFEVRKFRTMLPDSEAVDPVDDEENDRITRVGRLLRKSHLDELPQLWAIFTGEMSVVGPRAVWTDEEELLERQAVQWRKRWFVKPGLTGLAQINEVSSTDPEGKLRYDLEYIRRQSFWFDLKIVLRQVWLAVTDVYALVRGRDPDADTGDPAE
ncbi:sugar transferase [Halalkalicoccus sp. NIPERK01]|uniref:sugar transferase n=1 Tax=Halalkalicoccus sp. NIPERK01 TaxID=3053469 RepID=UPI00256F2FF7|nr:sugar transferase [Halalkalicoccus sp. NIPERK01]MDL5363420.1 sugar transferase [Halalkalicoccus sp. NIPERK01]